MFSPGVEMTLAQKKLKRVWAKILNNYLFLQLKNFFNGLLIAYLFLFFLVFTTAEPVNAISSSPTLDVCPGTTLVVTNIDNSGSGSLRQTIEDANLCNDLNEIEFNIPGNGPHIISPTSALPDINFIVTIDGLTQSGTECTSLPNATDMQIVLDGSNVPYPLTPQLDNYPVGLKLKADNSTIRGLVINNFSKSLSSPIPLPFAVKHGVGIEVTSDNNTIQCNFIGTGAVGDSASSNVFGLFVENGSKNEIAHNLISGNSWSGIAILAVGEVVKENNIHHNYIGVNLEGTVDLGNTKDGITIVNAKENSIRNNLISGNNDDGIDITDVDVDADSVDLSDIDIADLLNVLGMSAHCGGTPCATGNIISNNQIGTNAAGTGDIGNGDAGVQFEDAQGNIIQENLIAFNKNHGVFIKDQNEAACSKQIDPCAIENTITQNAIFDNEGSGIDFKNNANNNQSAPILASANGTTLEGTLESTANSSFHLEFFANSTADSSGSGEGEEYLGSKNVITDNSGNASFSFDYIPITGKTWISATATRQSTGDTSQFATSIAENIAPTVVSTSPTAQATEVAIEANINIEFSEDVTVSGTWFTIQCDISGSLLATVSGGFQSYTLDPDNYFSNGDNCTVTIIAAQVADQDSNPINMVDNYQFNFTTLAAPSPHYSLRLTTAGTGTGTVSSIGTPAGTTCGPNCLIYLSTTPVILKKTATNNSSFVSWSCTPTFISGSTLTSDTTCTATFNKLASSSSEADNNTNQSSDADNSTNPVQTLPSKVTLSIELGGSGLGRVETEPAGMSCNNDAEKCQQTFDANTSVTLKPVAATGSEFNFWGGNEDCNDNNVLLVKNVYCKAYFKLLPNTLTVIPNPSATITSTPPGIHCDSGNEPCTHDFDSGKEVTLIVVPNPGWQLTGWKGDCDNEGKVALDHDKSCEPQLIPLPTTLADSKIASVAENLKNDTLDLDIRPVDSTAIQTLMSSNPDLSSLPENFTAIMAEINPDESTDKSNPKEETPTEILSENPFNETPMTAMTPNLSPFTIPPCPTQGWLNWVCNAQGRTISDLEIGQHGNLSTAILIGTIDNHGFVSNLIIQPGGYLNGGIVSGYINNEGIIKDIDFRGASIIGGMLSGLIINSSEVDGYIKDVHLAADAKISGGAVAGEITGDAQAPALLENLIIKPGSHLKQVRIGENVELIDPVTLGEGVKFAAPTVTEKSADLMVEPVDDSSRCVNYGLEINSLDERTDSQTCFIYQLETSDGIQPNHVTLTPQQAETLHLSTTLLVASEHVGQSADILIIGVYQTSTSQAAYMRVGENWIPWKNRRRYDLLQSFESYENLPERLEISIFEGDLNLSPGEFRIFAGYRLTKNQLMVYNGKEPLHFSVNRTD